MRRKNYLSFIKCFCLLWVYGQQEPQPSPVPDFLLQRSYDELESAFKAAKNDVSKAKIYADAYLQKAIAGKDTVKQADAWYLLASVSSESIVVKYADSIIALTKAIKDDRYPARAFLAKALALQRMGKYKEALDELLQARNAIANDNASQQLAVKYQMGLLKTDLGEDEEALAIFRAYVRETEKRYKADGSNANNYIGGLFALGDAYNRTGQYDSAAVTNKKGFDISLKHKDSLNAKYFTLSTGITEYLKGNYDAGLDSIREAEKALIARNDASNLTICYLYMGRIYRDQGKIKAAVPYFKKVDSIVKETANVFPDIIDAYTSLKHYYAEKGDKKNQLKYLERQIKVVELLNNEHKYLREKIKNYDREQLRFERNELIYKIRVNKTIWIVFLSVVVLFLGAFTYYYYRRQQRYRARLETLLKNKGVQPKEQLSKKAKTAVLKILSQMAPETRDSLSKKLDTFESNKEFLETTVSLSSLAERWGTNSSYLNPVIKDRTGKTFRHYIRGLRIDYADKRLRTDPIFRRYTVEAIAEETGYNNADTFSRAFYREKGVHPSDFIKGLIKTDKEKDLKGKTADY